MGIGRRLVPIHALGDHESAIGIGEAVFRVAAAGRHRHHAIAFLEGRDFRTDRIHYARHLGARA